MVIAPVSDVERACAFYVDTLGFRLDSSLHRTTASAPSRPFQLVGGGGCEFSVRSPRGIFGSVGQPGRGRRSGEYDGTMSRRGRRWGGGGGGFAAGVRSTCTHGTWEGGQGGGRSTVLARGGTGEEGRDAWVPGCRSCRGGGAWGGAPGLPAATPPDSSEVGALGAGAGRVRTLSRLAARGGESVGFIGTRWREGDSGGTDLGDMPPYLQGMCGGREGGVGDRRLGCQGVGSWGGKASQRGDRMDRETGGVGREGGVEAGGDRQRWRRG